MTTILCIEDEPAIRQDIVEELNDAGFETLEASDGEEGLAVIRGRSPDLVLCDISMPRMDGYELLKQVRANYPQYSELPFIFLSALADRKDVVSGMDLGADNYLTKPIDFEMLLTSVAATLRMVARMREQKQREQVRLYKSLTKSPHPPPRSPPSQGGTTAPKRDASNFEEDLKGILQQGMTGSAGRLHFINLAELKEVMGDAWEKQAKKAMTIAESVINRHLSDGAVCTRHENDSFLLVLPELREQEAVVLVETIADEIATRLLGADYRTFRHLSLTAAGKSMKEIAGGGGHVTKAAFAAAFMKRAENAGGAGGRKIDVISRMLQQLTVGYQPVWHGASERVIAYHACPQLPSFEGGFEGFGAPDYSTEAAFVADIDIHLISLLADQPSSSGAVGGGPVTILPIHYGSLVGDDHDRLVEAFRGFAEGGPSSRVMIEVMAIPDSADAECVRRAIGISKRFFRRVIVRGSPDQKFAAWAGKAGAALLSIGFEATNDDGNRAGKDPHMGSFSAGARALGLEPYAHGLNTLGGVEKAIRAGFALLAGPAIGRVLDHPGETYRLRRDRLVP